MDRINIYVGKLASELSIDKFDQDDMAKLGKAMSAMLGSTTVARGLACTPTSVASMLVDIAPGEVYLAAPLEATVCCKDDAEQAILKHGIAKNSVVVPNADTGVTAFAAPAIAGQSINYLIEAAYADADVSVDQESKCCDVGVGDNIFRKGIVALKIKAGIAAATGAQVTPDVDSGYAGLWVVTLATGQTEIDAANIVAYVESSTLPDSVLASIQSGNLQYGIDVSTTANVIQGSFPTPPTALVDNQIFWVRIKNSNSGAVTFTPNAGVIGAAPVVGAAQVALQGGECVVNGRALLVWRADIASYVLESCTGSALQVTAGSASQHAATLAQVQSGLSSYAIDTGTANTYAVTLSPAITAYTDGVKIRFRALTANSGASTLNVNGLGAVALVGGAHVALAGGEIISGGYCEVEYNGALSKFVLLKCTGAALQVAAAASGQHVAQFSQISGVVGQVRNLAVSITTVGATAMLTADEIIVETALGGLRYCLSNIVNKPINLATTGAGGMDTGTAPASGYVAIYAIYNPTSGASALLATNATSAAVGNVYGGANMPAGYTASALISVLPTNTTAGQFALCYQIDRKVYTRRVQQLNTTASAATLTALVIGVPYNAKEVSGDIQVSASVSTNLDAEIAANALGLGQSQCFATSTFVQPTFAISMVTPRTIYYIASAGSNFSSAILNTFSNSF